MPIKMRKRDVILREKPTAKPLCVVKMQDGQDVTIYSGDTYCPPGRRGLHVNSTGYWVKAEGQWCLLRERSTLKARDILQSLPNLSAVVGVSDFRLPLNPDECE